MRRKRVYSEVQLNRILIGYQKLLNLTDWKLRVELVDQKEFEESKCRIEFCVYYKEGRILIPTEDTYKHNKFFPQDMRHDLIHELIHLHFSIVDSQVQDDSTMKVVYERAINDVASAFCELVGEPKVFSCDSCHSEFADHNGIFSVANPLDPKSVIMFHCHKCSKEPIKRNEHGDVIDGKEVGDNDTGREVQEDR